MEYQDLETSSLFLGHWRDLRRDTLKVMDEWIQKYGPLVGIYCGEVPCVFLSDLDAIKDCLVKRSHEFRDRVPLIVNAEPLKSSLLGIKGEEWKMCEYQRNPDDPFLTSLRETLIGADNPIMNVAMALPAVRRLLKLVLPYVHYGKMFTCVTESVRDVIKARRLLEDGNREKEVRAVDMLQLMLDARYKSNAKNDKCDRLSMTDQHVVSNCFVALGGGFETTSLTLALLLDELARNPEEQQKLYAELSSAFPGDVTPEVLFDKLQYFKRLEMVINEGLRKYPPLVFFTARMCYRDTELAGKIIPGGTRVIVPTWNIHRNPDLWPDPHRFNPDRFSEGWEKERHPASYVPFGMGPRECIGKKFALLELKMALFKLVRRYEFSLSTQSATTLKFEVPLISINPVKNIVLKVKRRRTRAAT
ncbi:hypothetical protein MTO96_049845 [Rhipicephalus appendiculatus]